MSGKVPLEPAVYYLVPDFPEPSWGTGLLYHHVRLLRRNGVAAWALHHRAPFRLEWLDVDVPVRHLDEPGFAFGPGDLLVVPEVLAREAAERPFPGRKTVFVQGAFLILAPFAEAINYRDLGYAAAMTTMPHAAPVVERHFGLKPAIVPPFVAPYVFARPEELEGERPRRIVLFPKEGYAKAGVPDYGIAKKLLARACAGGGPGLGAGWELLEIAGRHHREAAAALREAAFLVSVNTHETFNATVPEAMAAGCIPVCYEAVGGADYLVDRENAYVLPNHHLYSLLDTLFDLMARYGDLQDELARIRQNGYATADRYREEATEEALLAFLGLMIS